MNIVIKINLLAVFLIMSICVCAQTNTFTSAYNLDFRSPNTKNILFDWGIASGNIAYANMQLDSTLLKRDKYPYLMAPVSLAGFTIPIYMSLSQTIALPKWNETFADVSLSCKSKNLYIADLVVQGIDKDEHVVQADTIYIGKNSDWNYYTGKVSLEKVVKLYLRLDVRGNGRDDKGDVCEQGLWLDNLAIRLEGQDIDDYPLADAYGTGESLFGSASLLSFMDEDSYNNIKELKEKKILTIGESFHGSATMMRVAEQLIKYQVTHNNCKLILLERPMTQLLLVNRYIQGDEAFKLEDILSLQDRLSYGDELVRLFSWLKQYNVNSENKVSLYGMDVATENLDDEHWLYRYLLTLGEKYKSHMVDSLCFKVLGSGYGDVAQKIAHSDEFKKWLDDCELDILLYSMNRAESIKNNFVTISRDSIMFRTANYLITKICSSEKDRTIIYSHLFHGAYNDVAPDLRHPMLGTFMREEYGTDYGCIGLLIGDGSRLTITGDGVTMDTILPPVKHSLESILCKYSQDYFYAPIQSREQYFYSLRCFGFFGNRYANIVPYRNMDGVIFVRQSQPIACPKELLNKMPQSKATTRMVDDYKAIRERLRK